MSSRYFRSNEGGRAANCGGKRKCKLVASSDLGRTTKGDLQIDQETNTHDKTQVGKRIDGQASKLDGSHQVDVENGNHGEDKQDRSSMRDEDECDQTNRHNTRDGGHDEFVDGGRVELLTIRKEKLC